MINSPCVALVLTLASLPAVGAGVYRCDDGGPVAFSDRPLCAGAELVAIDEQRPAPAEVVRSWSATSDQYLVGAELMRDRVARDLIRRIESEQAAVDRLLSSGDRRSLQEAGRRQVEVERLRSDWRLLRELE